MNVHAAINHEICVEQPEGHEQKSETGKKLVCKLQKSINGLKQSGRNYYIHVRCKTILYRTLLTSVIHTKEKHDGR